MLFATQRAPEPARISKLARILLVEDKRTPGELERYLRDPDRGVRRRAALAAGRIGDPTAVPTLIELMNDSEAEVRQMSAFAMGLIGDKLAVERLVASLKDGEPVVRARSAEALGRIGNPQVAGDVAHMLLDALPKGAPLLTVRGDDPGNPTDPWLELRLGLFALARLKDIPAASSVLLTASGTPRFDWWAATYTAMRLESPALRPVLIGATSSSDPLSRALGARGLGNLKDQTALDRLRDLCSDKDPGVVVNALRALAVLGDPRGTAAAGGALASDDLTIRVEALRAVAALPPDRTLRARIVPYVGSDQPWIRAAALQALARVDRDEFTLVLSALDPDPVWSVRAALATALGDARNDVSLGVLFSMLKDEDPRVLPFVLEALAKARGADAADTLKHYLEHKDFAVRAAAAQGLADLKVADLKVAGISEALASAYRASLPDLELDARIAQVAALATAKDALAKATLREAATGDPSRVVRQRAAEALKALGEDAPSAGADSVDRPYLDYREAMTPYDPPPGVPLYTPRALIHTPRGTIEILLDILYAPLTSASFMDLARRGFYNGLTFHRVVPGYVIQGGDPRGDSNGGPGYTLRCEMGERPYGRGAVGMALSGKDTGGSQFFITHVPTPQLDGGYTLFGWVSKGMEVVDQVRPGDVIERIEIWDGR
jgi:cyclophilin family peptidyl-prolyl cis-trans isomerase